MELLFYLAIIAMYVYGFGLGLFVFSQVKKWRRVWERQDYGPMDGDDKKMREHAWKVVLSPLWPVFMLMTPGSKSFFKSLVP